MKNKFKNRLMLGIAMLLVVSLLCSCSGGPEAASSEGADSQGDSGKGKVAIITNTVSATEEEYRTAEELVKKYDGRLIHVTWPENSSKEQEQMITTMAKVGANPDVKAIVINQAMPGTNAAIDKLRETREDILIICCNLSENGPDVAKRADIGIVGDNINNGTLLTEKAHEMGAKTLIHYSFPRHMSVPIFSDAREKMIEKCKELDMQFVDVTTPDPTGDAGTAGAQQFILDDVPRQVEKYGPDTAFYATNCAMQIPLIQRVAELKAIYPCPCCASPYHGFPAALGIEVPEDKKSDTDYVIEETRKKLAEYGALGRFANKPVPGPMLLNNVGVSYAFKWIDGETDGKLDEELLKKEIADFAGVECTFTHLTDSGVEYDNILMYLIDLFTY